MFWIGLTNTSSFQIALLCIASQLQETALDSRTVSQTFVTIIIMTDGNEVLKHRYQIPKEPDCTYHPEAALKTLDIYIR